MKQSLVHICCFMLLCSSVLTLFSPGPQILWKKTDILVQHDHTNILLDITFRSICDFINISNFSGSKKLILEKRCHEMFNQNFLRPLSKNCDHSSYFLFFRNEPFDFDHNQKRNVIKADVIMIAYVGLTTADSEEGLILTNTSISLSKNGITYVSNRQNKLNEALHLVKQRFYDISKIYPTESPYDYSKRYEAMLDILMEIDNRFRDLKYSLMIDDGIRDNVISYEFLRHFNISLPCSPYCNQVPITMLNCRMEPTNSRMILHINVPIVSSHDFVLKADPFMLTSVKNNEFCTSTYTGPNFVLFNDQYNTFCAIEEKDLIGLPFNLFQIPSTCLANQMNQPNITKSWSTPNCRSPKEDDKTRYNQIKLHANNYYIYCPSGNISLLNVTYKCPSHVFTLYTDREFQMNSVTFKKNYADLSTKYDVNPLWIQNINKRIASAALTDQLLLENLSGRYFSNLTLIFLSILLIFSAFIIVYLVLYFCKKTETEKTQS